jgi:hypothetical protein
MHGREDQDLGDKASELARTPIHLVIIINGPKHFNNLNIK